MSGTDPCVFNEKCFQCGAPAVETFKAYTIQKHGYTSCYLCLQCAITKLWFHIYTEPPTIHY
jgi:hypothetical protein